MNKTKKILLFCFFLVVVGGSFFYFSKKYFPRYNRVPKCSVWFTPTENAPFTVINQKSWDKFFSDVSICNQGKLLVHLTTPTFIPNQPMITPYFVHDLELRFEYHPEEDRTSYKDGSLIHASYLELVPEKNAAILYVHIAEQPIEGYSKEEFVLAGFGTRVNQVLNNVSATDYLEKPIEDRFVFLRTHPEIIGVQFL